MTSNQPISSFHRSLFPCTALILTALAALPARAADRFWITTGGGQYSLSPNWSTTSGGAGGATVPGSGDVIIFDQNGTYTTTLTVGAINQTLRVSDGAVTLNLGGNTLTATTGVSQVGTLVGETAQLALQHGTLDVTGSGLRVGESSGRTGILNVSTNSHLITNGIVGLGAGSSGVGTINVTSGGTVATSVFNLGVNDGSMGTATVSGINSSLSATGNMVIGGSGTGSLTVSSGAQVNVASTVSIAQPGGIGALSITGAGSQFSLTGGQWNLGAGGQGAVTVSGGGTLVTSVSVIFGNGGGSGAATVTGAGSVWNSSTSIGIGSSGGGELSVTGGGTVNLLALNVAQNTGAGSVFISGAGATVNGTSAVIGKADGTGGTALVSLSAGGVLNLTGVATLNDPVAGTATLQLNGGTVNSTGFVRNAGVLDFDDGLFVVSGAGKTFDNSGALTLNGSGPGALPVLRLAGGAGFAAGMAGSPLTIGTSQAAALELTGGAIANVASVKLGTQGTGSGTVSLTGSGTKLNAGSIALGGTPSAAGGAGMLSIGPGAAATAAGSLYLHAGGAVVLHGGALTAQTLEASGGTFDWQSGRVTITGVFTPSSTAFDALLGAGHVLGFGRTLETANAMNLATSLTVSGGSFEATSLDVDAGGVFTQAAGHSVFSGSVSFAAGSRLFHSGGTMQLGESILFNAGEITMQSPFALISGANLMFSSGILQGTGRLGINFNNAAGSVRVAGDDRLVFAGATNSNSGRIELTNGGTVEFLNAMTNENASGIISGRNGTLRFGTGSVTTAATNQGSMTFSNGTMDIYGDINNALGGRIVISGGGSANFYGDVANSGIMQCSAAGALQSTAVFFGTLSGNGIGGGGHVFIEGDATPGFSPGTMAFGGDVSFGPLAGLSLEIGGSWPGFDFDNVTVADNAVLGGTLDLAYINGFTAEPGDTFLILDAGRLTGAFDTIIWPDAQGWFAAYDYTGAGTLTVGIVPEPSVALLVLAGAAFVRRRR